MRISDWSSDVCSSDLDYAEFVAAKAGDLISAADRFFKFAAHRNQHHVAIFAPRGVVDGLESVQVHEAQAMFLACPPGALQGFGQGHLKLAAIGKAGQRIVQRLVRSEEHTSELQSLMRIS